MNKSLLFLTLLVSAIAVLTACTTTIRRPKDPIFTKSTDSMKVELGTLFSCENLRVGGGEITTNGATSSELEIDVINGTRFPEAGDQQNALAKAIASYIKRALKDNTEYDTYKVLFVTETTQSGASVRKWKGQVFKSKEL
jgi:hypothetical protein